MFTFWFFVHVSAVAEGRVLKFCAQVGQVKLHDKLLLDGRSRSRVTHF